MRLLNVDSFELVEHLDSQRPTYAIASHRWDNDEATFADIKNNPISMTKKPMPAGYKKVREFANYVKTHIPGVDWLWIDTCCINKENAAELSEAINSMFDWYRDAEVCLAYLAKVESIENEASFRQSEWFERGWTLQELLAPRVVVFLTRTWQVIGNKGAAACGYSNTAVGCSLEDTIARVTRIPPEVLRDYEVGRSLPASEKLQWMEGRKTTREEDLTYALFGIFGVFLPVIYGEKGAARDRLMDVILQREKVVSEQAELYRKIAAWISPVDPWENHETARKQHEPETGAWLLKTELYKTWKAGSSHHRHLWLNGPAGSGKTILCSTAIEDVQTQCRGRANIGQAVFYFTFTDQSKQTYESLVRSMLVQLGCKNPGSPLLRQAYESLVYKTLGLDELYRILTVVIRSYDKVFLHLDGLDECPLVQDVRLGVLTSLEMLLQDFPEIWLIATSRDYPEIRSCMASIGALALPLDRKYVDLDVQKYVATQLCRDSQLRLWPTPSKKLVEDTLACKASGSFRWVVCQLQVLKKTRSTKPKSISKALSALPETLDDTYVRMLKNISEHDRADALVLLRYITYAGRPLTLEELAEAAIINIADAASGGGVVDEEDRGSWTDTLSILAGLVTVRNEDHSSDDSQDSSSEDNESGLLQAPDQVTPHAKVSLAHFSVQEFLESTRIRTGEAKMFHFDPPREHHLFTQSCLAYLYHYSSSAAKCSDRADFNIFLFLAYARDTWHYHARLQTSDADRALELSFLTSARPLRDYLRLRYHYGYWTREHTALSDAFGTDGLYEASCLGLTQTVQLLIERGVNVNAPEGSGCFALGGASEGGHTQVVKLLLKHKADVNAQGGRHGYALHAASYMGHIEIVQLLLEHGADVNAQGGHYGYALQAASHMGRIEIVQLLLEYRADVNAQGGMYGTALQSASRVGDNEIVQLLLEHKADVNAQGGFYGTALIAASRFGHTETVRLLIRYNADVNAQNASHCNALQIASKEGHKDVEKLLLENGALRVDMPDYESDISSDSDQ